MDIDVGSQRQILIAHGSIDGAASAGHCVRAIREPVNSFRSEGPGVLAPPSYIWSPEVAPPPDSARSDAWCPSALARCGATTANSAGGFGDMPPVRVFQ